jgi:hypothetical protein
MEGSWLDSSGSGQGPMRDTYEHGTEPLCSVKGMAFLTSWVYSQLLKKDFAACNKFS